MDTIKCLECETEFEVEIIENGYGNQEVSHCPFCGSSDMEILNDDEEYEDDDDD